jgi:hypothetical protein
LGGCGRQNTTLVIEVNRYTRDGEGEVGIGNQLGYLCLAAPIKYTVLVKSALKSITTDVTFE